MNYISQKLSIKEKIGYSLGDLAANLVFQTLMTYLAYFYTDIYGLSPTDSSIIMLVVGLIAAFIFNPIIGVLADRTSTKWGKYRPWILITAIPLGVIALLAFSTPDFSYHGKVIYAVVTYTLLLLFYASNNLPYSALSGVITGDMRERNSLSSYRFLAVMFAQFFVQVFMLGIIKPETSKSYSLGLVLEPIKNISLSIDWWKIVRDGEINGSDPGAVVSNPAGYPDAGHCHSRLFAPPQQENR